MYYTGASSCFYSRGTPDEIDESEILTKPSCRESTTITWG